MLRDDQIERYSRQILLPHVGGKGQEKLLKASVLVIGAGGLGSPASFYLAAAGVGRIGIVDSDAIDLSNLQRQILHATKDVGVSKAESARARLTDLNPDVEVIAIKTRLTSANILDIIKDYDIILDGTDNFPSRYLINDACVIGRKPLSHGGIYRFDGQAMLIYPGKGPCYRCLFPEPPPPGAMPSCQEAGILGVVAGVIGIIQANEALKLILGIGEPLIGRLLVFNALSSSFRTVKVPRNEDCAICGRSPTIKKLIDYEEFCQVRKRVENSG